MVKYLAAYLTSKYNYHRDVQHKSDNFEYIKEYYQSIVKLNLNAVIIVDDSSDEFIQKYFF